MTNHPPANELELYRQRGLTPAAFLAVHRHLATCPSCTEQSDALRPLVHDFEELRAALVPDSDETPYHLSSAEVEAYCRNELNEIDLEIAESHLVICVACSDEVQTRAGAAADLRDPLPAGDDRRTVFPRGWPIPFRVWDGPRPWRIAAVVVGAAILILLALFLFRAKTANRSAQTVPLETANTRPAPVPGNNRNEVVTNQRANENLPNNVGESQPPPPVDEGPPTAAQLVVALNDGGQRITLDNRGELGGLERLPAHAQQAVKGALQAGRVERPAAIAQLTGRPSTLLSPSDNVVPFRLTNPVGVVVESERPVLRWSTLEGARSYTVSVTDVNLNEVAASPPLTSTEWRMTTSLKPGAIYSWQVTALKDGKEITSPVLPAPQAKFRVVDRETLEVLRHAKRSYRGSHLAAGVLYAQAGLLAEAEKELRAVVRANPHDRTAREILHSVQAMR